jgi:hypothetical protein
VLWILLGLALERTVLAAVHAGSVPVRRAELNQLKQDFDKMLVGKRDKIVCHIVLLCFSDYVSES